MIALNQAIRRVRHSLSESQQAFAFRMKTAIRTVARWEAGGRAGSLPRAKALVRLERLAKEQGLDDCARVFSKLLRESVLTVDFLKLPHHAKDVVRLLKDLGKLLNRHGVSFADLRKMLCGRRTDLEIEDLADTLSHLRQEERKEEK